MITLSGNEIIFVTKGRKINSGPGKTIPSLTKAAERVRVPMQVKHEQSPGNYSERAGKKPRQQ